MDAAANDEIRLFQSCHHDDNPFTSCALTVQWYQTTTYRPSHTITRDDLYLFCDVDVSNRYLYKTAVHLPLSILSATIDPEEFQPFIGLIKAKDRLEALNIIRVSSVDRKGCKLKLCCKHLLLITYLCSFTATPAGRSKLRCIYFTARPFNVYFVMKQGFLSVRDNISDLLSSQFLNYVYNELQVITQSCSNALIDLIKQAVQYLSISSSHLTEQHAGANLKQFGSSLDEAGLILLHQLVISGALGCPHRIHTLQHLSMMNIISHLSAAIGVTGLQPLLPPTLYNQILTEILSLQETS